MSRIAVWKYANPEKLLAGLEFDQIVGSFETDTANYWIIGGDSYGQERIWHTPSGRWVHSFAKEVRYLTPLEARQVLVARDHEAVAHELIDRVQNGPGRPPVGDEVKARLPREAISQLDALAAANGTSRAEEMRVLILDGLATINAT